MIRRIQLRGWKAFDLLDLEPKPGVTFVTARNGVGKSSLIQGTAWAIFGERSGIDASHMARIGHSRTSTTVELDTADGQVLRIDREVGRAAIGHIGDAQIDDLDEALRAVVGANLDFAARAVTLNHHSLLEHASSFTHLETHLAEVFGIGALSDAAAAMSAQSNEIRTANTRLRTAAKKAAPDVAALRDRARDMGDELEALRLRRDTLAPEVAAAVAAQAAAAAREAAATRLDQHRASVAALRERVANLIGEATANLAAAVTAAIVGQDDALSALTMELGADEARLSAARDAITSLEQPGAICPTCRRPLSDQERTDARSVHTATIGEVSASLDENRLTVGDLRERSRILRQLLSDIERLGPEPEVFPSDNSGPTEDPVAVIERSRELERQIGQHQGALTEIERALASASSSEQEEATLSAAVRREAAAQMTADLMNRTVAALMAERVAPIRHEVSARWKQVFGDRGTLELSPAGVISMERGGHTIEFSAFSPGEQVVAMLALRFLTVAASTTSPFMLLDEPLECLDPPNRRLIASVLADADRPVEQMIVTTYEEALVRRIHATNPDVDVRVIG
jgi:DNA repair exonuclease SbcCD ATPase subunit